MTPPCGGRGAGTAQNGQLRKKRGDTRARTLEMEYGVELTVPGNTRLDTMRTRTGETSVAKVIEKLRKK